MSEGRVDGLRIRRKDGMDGETLPPMGPYTRWIGFSCFLLGLGSRKMDDRAKERRSKGTMKGKNEEREAWGGFGNSEIQNSGLHA